MRAAFRISLVAAFAWVCAGIDAAEPPQAPRYEERYLVAIYPAGGQRGQTVSVEFRAQEKSVKGGELHGLKDALGIVIDGPPGITVGKVENVSDLVVRAELKIAADAVPGRRMLRVHSGRTGLTNFSYFVVGTLPETNEKEPNNDLAQAQSVTLPIVVNGCVSQPLDMDCFRFEARRGQKLTAAVSAYDIDSRTFRPRAFVDAALELFDAEGRVVADAADVLGLDPLIEAQIPADGVYTARVKLVNYQGFPTAIYRLTLGEVPYPTALFPAAIERGKSTELTLVGPNIPSGAKLRAAAPANPDMPQLHVAAAEFGTHDLPLMISDLPESVEREPNDEQKSATTLVNNSGINARFDRAGDVDWYRLPLKKGDKVRCEIHAQRHLRSSVDTLVKVFDAAGAPLEQNDDRPPTDVERIHDFNVFDSQVSIDAAKDGDYFLRVTEQTGTFGERAVYHLSVADRKVEVRLHAWPDAVPVWGAGSTAGFVVTLDRIGAKPDVALRIEGLAAGWQGSAIVAEGTSNNRFHVLLTVTAPPTAKPGDMTTFRVVGSWKVGDQTVEAVAQPLTSYMADDDRELCRVSPVMRAVVGYDVGLKLAAETAELTVTQGQRAELPVRINRSDLKELPVSVNLAGNSVAMSLGVPQRLLVKDGVVRAAIACDSLPPGQYPIVVALAWGSETRQGMPGPCTQVLMLKITPADAKTAAK